MSAMASPSPSRESFGAVYAPTHPVPHLQGPFEESMLESVNDVADQESEMDAVQRRTMLLEKPHYERVCAGRWKQKPGEKYHPLWKIAAQLSFGMHLLAEGMAKSEVEVMRILQSHVDDVDGFLERTTEDFDLALGDVQERLRYLRLPLEHAEVFDRMLEDRVFRASIVNGNEKIEHIVNRTSKAIRDAMKDVQKGLDATRALGRYLEDLESLWTRNTAEHEAVFVAMLGNVEGWGRAFMDLHLQGNRLKVILVELSETVSEMMRRAGVVSRQSVRQTQMVEPVEPEMPNGKTKHHKLRSSRADRQPSGYKTSRSSPQKALPSAPDIRNGSRQPDRKRPSTRQRNNSGSTQASSKLTKTRLSPHSSSGLIPSQTPEQSNFYARPFSLSYNRAATPSGNSTLQPSIRNPATSSNAGQPRRPQHIPIELPADVPHDVLLQAPLSKENRRSMNLGPKREEDGHRPVSKKLSSKVLQSLLKSPLSTRLSRTPQSVASGIPVSYTTANESPPGQMAEYFSVTEVRNTIVEEEPGAWTASSPDSRTGGVGIKEESLQTSSPGQVRSATPVTRSQLPHNPAFTSHPPEMGTIESPHIKQGHFLSSLNTIAASAGIDPNPAHSRGQSLVPSSLGEPGPEIDDSEPFDLAALKPAGNDPVETSVRDPKPSQVPLQVTDNLPTDVEAPSALESPIAGKLHPTAADVAPSNLQRTSDDAARPVLAELEGITSAETPATQSAMPEAQSLIELEAPRTHCFSLPPRSSAIPQVKPDEGGMTSATIASQSDFFKMPPTQVAHVDGSPTKPQALTITRQAYLSMPLSSNSRQPGHSELSPVREDRSSSPPALSIRTIQRKPATRTARLKSSDVFDQISATPPGSPIHTRSPSELSANSARRLSDPLSVQHQHPFAPSQEAPPPPAPGGRPMVSPDYAAAGIFDGERVKPKHGSRGSTGSNIAGWKKFFGGTSDSPLSGTPPAGSKGTSTGQNYFEVKEDSTDQGNRVDMMTSAGKDVLWFKGMSRDGQWVSATSG